VQGADRAIVIFGLSHSATTVLTYVLSTHSKIRLIVDGAHREVLESDALVRRDWQMIQAVLLKYPEQYLIFKHPWAQENMSFFAKYMQEATYLYCWREMEDVSKSWRKHGGPTPYGPMEQSWAVHCLHRELKNRFSEVVMPAAFMVVNHDNFVLNPVETMEGIATLLGVEPDFNLEIVKPGKTWDRQFGRSCLHAETVRVRGSKFRFFTRE